MNEDNCKIVSMGQIEIRPEGKESLPASLDDLPILATRNLVLFPGVMLPIALVRDNARRVAREAADKHIPVGICCQLDPKLEKATSLDQVFNYGVVAYVLDVVELPDGSHTALVQGRFKFKVEGPAEGKTIADSELNARVKRVNEPSSLGNETETAVFLDTLKDAYAKITEKGSHLGMELNITALTDPALVINLIATNIPFDQKRKMELLAIYRLKQRGLALLNELTGLLERISIADEIKERAREGMNQQNRNVFLQQQMEAIREELYGSDTEDADKLQKRASELNLPEHVRTHFEKELEKLRRFNPTTPDYSTLLSYLTTLLDLPWNVETPLNTDFSLAEEILDRDHYGLEKVKDRILEQLAVVMNNPDGKAPILCLVGAPGVGKTSLGKSVAEALGRNYQRVSLGGLHDEAEIRGHRRTYIGAMPGRIIDAMKRAQSSNPVLLLDEIDKIGADFKGDPSAALLEVLDPEQNCHFHDNYIDVDYDLSKVLFIATANTLSTISRPLLDRMEIIEISGYLPEEKVEIANRHLLPRLLDDHKLSADELKISQEAMNRIIEAYTSESGVRQLEKSLASVVRKAVLRKMQNRPFPPVVEAADLTDILGMERHQSDRYEGNSYAGVVTGLAWTAVGGEILFIESSLTVGKGEKLTLTGNLGDVMKESAVIALQYVKSHASLFGINPALFDKYNLHIHVPEGAIPKDGPSAGITMATSIVSAFRQTKVRRGVAMTGEITLRGKVLPVGGIKEKILAAKRAGIDHIILSSENRRDINDINERYLKGLTFSFVDTVAEVIALAVTDEPADNPLDLQP